MLQLKFQIITSYMRTSQNHFFLNPQKAYSEVQEKSTDGPRKRKDVFELFALPGPPGCLASDDSFVVVPQLEEGSSAGGRVQAGEAPDTSNLLKSQK